MLKAMNWRDRITVDPGVCHGKVCVRGTRIPVSIVLDNLATGLTPAEIVKSYPTLQEADIQAVLGHAAELAREQFVPLLPGAS